MRHSKGYRNRGRKLLSKTPRERGRPGLSRILYEYKEGDLVCIDICPNYVSTAPHRRYQGRVGKIVGKRGRAYIIKVKEGGKEKTIITTKDHIKPFMQQLATE
ncbi:MAG: 50S ribosomal protein L21e [Thermofilaceae archaeon]|nr:50S ribosomal protein L21e [Thermofilaceae archaeon]MCX8180689.1 50S ribosomal protein L21e [Thermofilaceae archaeon]MDW8003793.1 50S ribosomal protein L21e [Thermofilaceae archaeon]